MKDVVGSPGTWSGLALRVSQFACAAASVAAMASAYGFKDHIAFLYLTSSMAWQLVCSLILGVLDIHALRTKVDLHNLVVVCSIIITDWCVFLQSTGIFALTAASSSAGVAIFLERDTELCTTHPHIPCVQYNLAASLALMAWSFTAASAAFTFWLLVSLVE